jgi:hypothetical protein
VQPERVVAGDPVAARDLLEQLQPARQGLGEAFLLGAEHLLDAVAVLPQLRVRVAGLGDHDIR